MDGSPFRRVNDEVFYTTGDIASVDGAAIGWLKERAAANPRRRARLCAHPGTDDTLHEMLIVHGMDAYVRPHRHLGKSESFHLIEGELSVLILDDAGTVVRRIDMAAPGGDKPFFYRLSAPLFHTVVPRSEPVVFHEVTNGPFRREETKFAAFAPEESADPEEQRAYVRRLLSGT